VQAHRRRWTQVVMDERDLHQDRHDGRTVGEIKYSLPQLKSKKDAERNEQKMRLRNCGTAELTANHNSTGLPPQSKPLHPIAEDRISNNHVRRSDVLNPRNAFPRGRNVQGTQRCQPSRYRPSRPPGGPDAAHSILLWQLSSRS